MFFRFVFPLFYFILVYLFSLLVDPCLSVWLTILLRSTDLAYCFIPVYRFDFCLPLTCRFGRICTWSIWLTVLICSVDFANFFFFFFFFYPASSIWHGLSYCSIDLVRSLKKLPPPPPPPGQPPTPAPFRLRCMSCFQSRRAPRS